MDVYLETVRKLAALKPRTLYYAHDGVGRNPAALIAAIAENTRIYTEAALEILQSTEDDGEALAKLRDFISERFGVERSEADEGMAVAGFGVYFRKRGLLPE
jgi:hypothetical protein